MWNQIERIVSPIVKQVNSLERQEWILVFVAVLVVGFMCMRGFGSRSKY